MMQLKLTAAAALSVVRTHQSKSSWDGDVVSFEWNHRRLKINSLTGQLIEQVVWDAPATEGQEADNYSTPHITSQRGEFARCLAEIEKATADWPNAADERRPLSCLAEFACDELQRFDAESKRGYAALGKLLSQGLMQPFDDLVCETCRPDADGFVIPKPYFHFHFNSFPELVALGPVLARAYGIRLGNHLFADDGWMRPLWRDGVLVLADGREQAKDDLSYQPAGERGAVCSLLSAEMLRAAAGPLSQLCARRGLRRLSPAAFRDDCRDLLSGRGFLSACLLHAAAALRPLDADEVKALAELLARYGVLDTAQVETFQHSAAALRMNNDDSPAQAAQRALDALWRAGLSDLIEQRLQALAAPPEILDEAGPYSVWAADAVPQRVAGAGSGLPVQHAPVPNTAGYGAARPGEALGHNRSTPTPPRQIGTYGSESPPEAAKPLKQEIRELKWLARAVTDRLEKLEERLQTEGADCGAAEGCIGWRQASEVPTGKRLEVLISGPAGVKLLSGSGPDGTEQTAVDLPIAIVTPSTPD